MLPTPEQGQIESDPFIELAKKEDAAKTHDEWIRIHNKGWLDLYRNGHITEEEYLKKIGDEREELERQAFTDPLTGILNRRGLDFELRSRLEASSRMAQRTGEYRGSVIFFDVDLFKLINDEYGHPVGDKALLAYVKAIQKVIRPGDIIGRYGGDEFEVYVNDATQDEAREIADRCRQAITEEFRINTEINLDWEQTTSAGISQFQIGDSLESLTKRADDALMFAKQQGRNRSEVWKEGMTGEETTGEPEPVLA